MNRSGTPAPQFCSRAFLELPLAKLTPQVVTREVRGEADYYGASQLIADQLGLKSKPRSYSKWTHGWINLRSSKSPEVIIDADTLLKKQKCYLVHTQDNVELLSRHGISNSVAVGAPFIYAALTEPIERIARSLLVMPSHGIEDGELSSEQQECVEHALDLRKDFEVVCFCIHEHTIRSTRMTEALDRYKIPWVQGAGLYDINSLKRLHVLFSGFEFMMSNSLGSHIPYAASLGCKVSLGGKFYERCRDDLSNTSFYRKHPHLLDDALHCSTESYARTRIPWGFQSHPAKAVSQTTWASKELGQEHQRTASEIAHLLGWSVWDQSYYRSREWLTGAFQTLAYQFRKRFMRKAF